MVSVRLREQAAGGGTEVMVPADYIVDAKLEVVACDGGSHSVPLDPPLTKEHM